MLRQQTIPRSTALPLGKMFTRFYSKPKKRAAEINTTVLGREPVPTFLPTEGRPRASPPPPPQLGAGSGPGAGGRGRQPGRFYGNRGRGRPSAGPDGSGGRPSARRGPGPGPHGRAGRGGPRSGPRPPARATVQEARLWGARAPGAAAARRGRRERHRRGRGRGEWRLPG